jgi:predicted small lipoprotein YifL
MVEKYNFTMLNVRQILMSTLGLCALGVGLAGCGLKGPLYLPTDPAAANRATLPSLIVPSTSRSNAATPAAPSDAAVAPPAAASSAPASTGIPR